MNSKVTVTDILIEDLRPRPKNPKYNKFLPSVLFSKRMSFTIKNINNAISNAIRRTLCCELLVSALFATNLTTNDVFIIPEMVLKRLRMIPLKQDTPLDAQFQLDVENNTAELRDVKSSEITVTYGGKGDKEHSTVKTIPFNETFVICTLMPGKHLKIPLIAVHQAYGMTPGDGMHAMAVHVTSTAVDQKPINLYEPDDDGIPSRISNPRVWKLMFTTNGTMEPRDIVITCCNNIIDRINNVKNILHSISGDNDYYILNIEGETDTIGNLFMKTILDLYPEIKFVVYTVSSVSRSVQIRIQCHEDIEQVFMRTIKYLTDVYRDISRSME